jgi:hypothetical protein
MYLTCSLNIWCEPLGQIAGRQALRPQVPTSEKDKNSVTMVLVLNKSDKHALWTSMHYVTQFGGSRCRCTVDKVEPFDTPEARLLWYQTTSKTSPKHECTVQIEPIEQTYRNLQASSLVSASTGLRDKCSVCHSERMHQNPFWDRRIEEC